jgi:flagellar biosynthesis activator protein FlaF
MQNAASAYARVSQTALSPREAEAAVLMKAARLLQTAREEWDAAGEARGNGFAEALGFNRKVWTLLSTAATEAGSNLPESVRRSMGHLGAFVLTQTIALLAAPDPQKVDPLIAINRQVAAGLRGQA